MILSLWLPIPSYADQITPSDCDASLAQPLPWGAEQISASRMMDADHLAVMAPVWGADLTNILLVLGAGDPHISLLSGESFKPLGQFSIAKNVDADPVFSPDGRYVFILSCDGWVQKYDTWSLRQTGRVRAGLNARNIVISADGKWLAIANTLPTALTILSSADLSLASLIKVSVDGIPSRLSAIYDNPSRESFIIALMDAPKIWEVFYGANPPQMGFAHDWRVEGPVPQSAAFPIRKITTADFLNDLTFDASGEYMLAAARQGGGMVIDLVIGQKTADLNLSGAPHFSGGFGWKRGATDVMAIAHLTEPAVSLIEMQRWKTVEHIATEAVVKTIRSHEKSNHLWIVEAYSQSHSIIEIVDKQTLEIVRVLGPMRRDAQVDVGFSKDGDYALILLGGDDGAVVVYDAATLQEVKRLPMRNPLKIFNVNLH